MESCKGGKLTIKTFCDECEKEICEERPDVQDRIKLGDWSIVISEVHKLNSDEDHDETIEAALCIPCLTKLLNMRALGTLTSKIRVASGKVTKGMLAKKGKKTRAQLKKNKHSSNCASLPGNNDLDDDEDYPDCDCGVDY